MKMKLKVAIPDNPMYAPLVARAEDVCARHNFELIRANERQCAALLLRNTVELALVSPLGYGEGVKSVDYRIVPGPGMWVQGYSALASIYFRQGIARIRNCAISGEDSFLARIGTIVLGEKFGAHLKPDVRGAGPEELLREYDAAIALGNDPALPASLDVSEEWEDMTGEALPLRFWVCRPDEMPQNLAEIVREMQAPEISARQDIKEHPELSELETRCGTIGWGWDESQEAALAKVLEMLFYLQYVPAIGAVKIFGRDPIEE